MLPNRRDVFASLKAEIPEGVPYVTSAEWPMEGWRPYKNVNLFHGQPHEQVIRLQDQYGDEAITIGATWDSAAMHPVHTAYEIGIYIKDVEAQVQFLHDQLDNYDRR